MEIHLLDWIFWIIGIYIIKKILSITKDTDLKRAMFILIAVFFTVLWVIFFSDCDVEKITFKIFIG